jgi:putative NIF3 family GTP cyclohydrolase 1 type 2
MKLKTLFQHAVEIGIKADPRGQKRIDYLLKKQKEKQKKLEGKEKEFFDEERTWNPFPDSRILAGTGDEDVTHLMVGIDIETPEILLADRLREKGTRIDAILVHHPEGRALMDLDKMMPMQADLLAGYGVPINQAEGELGPRMDRIRRSIHADNLFRTGRTAELLDLPLVGCHTITDNLAWQFMEKTIAKKHFEDLQEICTAITHIEEYHHYAKQGNGPIVVNGSSSGRPGRIVVSEFTGGTNGPEEQVAQQARAGVGTILTMHATEKALEEARKQKVNVIQCSHMASDALGVNLLLDELTKLEKKLTTIDVSGFIRIKRR